MEHLRRFKICDCYNRKLATFSVQKFKLHDFINESEIMLDGSSIRLSQRFFWYLAQKSCCGRTYSSLCKNLYRCSDAFFYLSYA